MRMDFDLFECMYHSQSSVGAGGASEQGWPVGLEREELAACSANTEPAAFLQQAMPGDTGHAQVDWTVCS